MREGGRKTRLTKAAGENGKDRKNRGGRSFFVHSPHIKPEKYPIENGEKGGGKSRGGGESGRKWVGRRLYRK